MGRFLSEKGNNILQFITNTLDMNICRTHSKSTKLLFAAAIIKQPEIT